MKNLITFTILILITLSFSLNIFAENPVLPKFNKNMVNQLKSLKLDKAQVKKALEMMVSQGLIDKKSAKMMADKIAGMSNKDLNNMKTKALKNYQSGAYDKYKTKSISHPMVKKEATTSQKTPQTKKTGFQLNNLK